MKNKSQSPSASTAKGEYVCVNCQSSASTMHKKYSEGVIRLTECKKCGDVVDKYIECDTVLVVLDLMLQYIQAYRHLILNVRMEKPERLFLIFWLSHAADGWMRDRNSNEEAVSEEVSEKEWIFYKCLVRSAVEISSYVFVILLFAYLKPNETKLTRLQIIGATLLGYYGNVAVVISFIFHLAHQTSYQFVMRLFLLISHAQVQLVLFPTISLSSNFTLVLAGLFFSYLTGFCVTYLFHYYG
uniref:Protein ARV n=1 Tax=Caenorhabditis tropicalis TaxID=1561998 RepID=A0A1I7SYY4_9PELO